MAVRARFKTHTLTVLRPAAGLDAGNRPTTTFATVGPVTGSLQPTGTGEAEAIQEPLRARWVLYLDPDEDVQRDDELTIDTRRLLVVDVDDWDAAGTIDHLEVQLADFAAADACTIERPTGEVVTDPTTGSTTPGTPETIYTGPCTIRATAAGDRVTTAGDARTVYRTYVVNIRAHADPVDIGDVVTATTAGDPGLLDTPLVVVDVNLDPIRNRRHLICEARPGVNP